MVGFGGISGDDTLFNLPFSDTVDSRDSFNIADYKFATADIFACLGIPKKVNGKVVVIDPRSAFGINISGLVQNDTLSSFKRLIKSNFKDTSQCNNNDNKLWRCIYSRTGNFFFDVDRSGTAFG